MPFNHESLAALPVATAANKAALRAMAVRRMAYCLDDAESAQDFVAVDPDAGTIPLYLVQNGRLFQYDAADTTSVHDGVTVLVSNEGKRYKVDTFAFPWSVKDKDLATPPGSPSVGDAYIVAASPTGAWAGKSDQVAVFTARGWQFAVMPIGKPIYVEDETAFYHRSVGGVWTRGFGNLALAANSVPPSALIGKPIRWHVINSTTNAPPGSPSVGNAYIVGSAPTGAWSGHAGKIAISEDGVGFTIYTPRTGEVAYDAAANADLRFNGTAWEAAGAVVGFKRVFTINGSVSSGGTGSYAFNASTAPTTSTTFFKDDATLTFTARSAASFLKFTYSAVIQHNAAANATLALFRDSEANAIEWMPSAADSVAARIRTMVFWVAAVDALSHTYHVRSVSGASASINSFERRHFSVEEFV